MTKPSSQTTKEQALDHWNESLQKADEDVRFLSEQHEKINNELVIAKARKRHAETNINLWSEK